MKRGRAEWVKHHECVLIINKGMPILKKEVSRNDLCYCGSGKKVKNCCVETKKYYNTERKVKAELN
jgi:uncharacterized protein YchJ